MNLPPLDSKSTKEVIYDIMRDPVNTLGDNILKYGDIYRQNIFSTSHYIVTNPNHVKYILETNAKNYKKPDKKLALGYFSIKQEMGESIVFTCDDNFWNTSRKAIVPSFMNAKYPQYADAIVENTLKLREKLQQEIKKDPIIDILVAVSDLACKNLFTTMIQNIDANMEDLSYYSRAWMKEISKKFSTLNPLPWILPTKKRRDYNTAKNKFNALLKHIIDQRMASKTKSDDMLDHIIDSYKDEKDPKKYLKIIEDQLRVLIIAGHDTTADSLAWTLAYLSMYPDVAAKVREEIKTVIGDRVITYNDLPSLTYTACVIKESLRLRSPGFFSFRYALNDDKLGDFDVPKGTIIVIPIYFVNRHLEFWNNPEGFDPNRFLNKPYGQDEKHAFIPFMAGNRACLGSNFAMVEMLITLAILLPKFNFNLLPGYLGIPDTSLVVFPKGGLKMQVTERDQTT